MTTASTIPISPDVFATVQKRLRAAGLLCLCLSVDGRPVLENTGTGDPLHDLLIKSPLFRSELQRALNVPSDPLAARPVRILDGCFALCSPIRERRRIAGWLAAICITPEFVGSEHMAAMCQSASLDLTLCQTWIRDLPCVSENELPRLARVIDGIFSDLSLIASERETIEKVSQQLAESYEEISLLYTMSQNMSVVGPPRRFVTGACEGLLETLSYAWIGARFAEESGGLNSVQNQLIVVGNAPCSLHEIHTNTNELFEYLPSQEPIALNTGRDPASAPDVTPLGRPLLVHPVTCHNSVIGLLLAGDKHGQDSQVASSDMKLLGAAASHLSIFLENAALYEDMDAMFLGTIEAISASIDAKDRYTQGHSQRVAQLSQQLASEIGLENKTVKRLHIAGLVHDVGKIGIPESVLSKPGRLTEEEFGIVKTHPDIGYRILKDIPQLRDILPGVLYHHERWDGRGYPRGITGDEIPLFARIIALADSFDAMSSDRTYRTARTRKWVLAEIDQCAGTQFDPELAKAFVKLDFSEFDRIVNEHRAVQRVVPFSREEAA